MSILTDALARGYAAQDAAGAQRRISWAPTPTGESEYPTVRRQEFLPTANRVSLKREGKRERMLELLRMGPCSTITLMMAGGSGFSSRLAELRRAGHVIACDEHEDGAIYTLVENS